jgi:membrane-bound acyltransferase YfiQ involved in biofilm formation
MKESPLVAFGHNIMGKVDLYTLFAHAIGFIFSIFMFAYMIFKQDYTMLPMLLMLAIVLVNSFANEQKVASLRMRCMFYEDMLHKFETGIAEAFNQMKPKEVRNEETIQ